MEKYGWTIQQVDESPYERMMELIIEKESEKEPETMSAAEWIKSL